MFLQIISKSQTYAGAIKLLGIFFIAFIIEENIFKSMKKRRKLNVRIDLSSNKKQTEIMRRKVDICDWVEDCRKHVIGCQVPPLSSVT